MFQTIKIILMTKICVKISFKDKCETLLRLGSIVQVVLNCYYQAIYPLILACHAHTQLRDKCLFTFHLKIELL